MPFEGWDFSYLNNRWDDESLPWDYNKIVKSYLKNEYKLLDIGTGDGKVLLTFNHPYHNTFVTEGYKPNYEICMEKLNPLGIKVFNYAGDKKFDLIDNNSFDIVINRHESYDEEELYRILKPGGIYITQQVGTYNNKDLASFFDEKNIELFPNLTLEKSIKRLEKYNFQIKYSNEYYPILKFYDLGAIAYFAKIIKWEFIDFSVNKYIDKFILLQDLIKEKGFISSKQHRFIIVAQKV